MKASELMIGDIVRQKGSGIILEIEEIKPPYIMAIGELGQFHEDTIEPIPLTPEILEKNGFEEDKEYPEQWCLAGEFQDVYVHEWSDSIWKVEIVNFEFSSMPVSQCTVCFVHELQHALKLCGIEKNIII